jgi:DNA-binding NarL/FixJ family response regulator
LPLRPAIAYNQGKGENCYKIAKGAHGTALGILIADPHVRTADSLFSIISQSRGDCELIGHASGAADAISLCSRLKPDLLLLEAGLSRQSGAPVLPKIKRVTPPTRILLYSTTANENEILDAMRGGADGLLEKSCSRSDFVAAVDRIAAGETHLCARSLDALSRALRRTMRRELRDRSSGLTAREQEVLALVTAGKSSKEIAKQLFVEVSTIETHRTNLMKKIGARNVAQLVQYAFENGLLATGRNAKEL